MVGYNKNMQQDSKSFCKLTQNFSAYFTWGIFLFFYEFKWGVSNQKFLLIKKAGSAEGNCVW